MEFLEELRLMKEQLKFEGRFRLPKNFSNVVLSGLGGSGISARIFQEIYSKKPVSLVEGYEIPDFVSPSTLFISMSYSGNTEEVLAAAKAAKKRKAHVVTISSHGLLEGYGDQHVKIPRPDLQPRSSLVYLLMPLLNSFGLAGPKEIRESYGLLSGLDGNPEECYRHARSIARSDAIPVIYGSFPFRAVAYRWKTQFNENPKILAYSSSFPELNHNDTMALAHTYKKNEFYFMVFASRDKRINDRIHVTEKLTRSKFNIINPKGTSQLSRILYLVHYGDYLSYKLSSIRGINPTDVSYIEKLKTMLKKPKEGRKA